MTGSAETALGYGSSVVVGRPDKLAACFEGLGDLCEFGVAQKFCGVEPLGLLRFASMPLDKLLHLLATQFADLKQADQIDVVTVGADPEWWGDIAAFGIRYHAAADSRMIPKAEMLARERQRIPFLARKILQDLQSGDKIFVRRDPGQDPGAVAALYQALRVHGANDLFWVDQARHDGEIGKVEMCAGGYLRGYLGHYWPNAAPSPAGLGIWLALLDQALARLRPARWRALAAEAALSLEAGADHMLAKAGWHGGGAAQVGQTHDIPAVDGRWPVLQHVASRDVSDRDGFVMACEAVCLQARELYVASCWVWLPDDFTGWVRMMVYRHDTVRIWPADAGLRNCWQRIATSFRCGLVQGSSAPGLAAVMGAGGVFYSTCWRLERGVVPFDCLPPLRQD